MASVPPTAATPLRIDEWLTLAEDEPGELVAGQLEAEEVTDAVHEVAVAWLLRIVGNWIEDRGGEVVGSELKLVTPLGGRKADASIYLPPRLPPRTGPAREPPDVLIEVVTPTPRDGRRDRIEKMNEYAAWGVPQYWLVDYALGTFEVYVLDERGRYERVVGAAEGVVEPPSCPGLTIDLDALWRRLSRLA